MVEASIKTSTACNRQHLAPCLPSQSLGSRWVLAQSWSVQVPRTRSWWSLGPGPGEETSPELFSVLALERRQVLVLVSNFLWEAVKVLVLVRLLEYQVPAMYDDKSLKLAETVLQAKADIGFYFCKYFQTSFAPVINYLQKPSSRQMPFM